jgi:hypothetical protein
MLASHLKEQRRETYLDGEHVVESVNDILSNHGWISFILCIQIRPPLIFRSPLGTL